MQMLWLCEAYFSFLFETTCTCIGGSAHIALLCVPFAVIIRQSMRMGVYLHAEVEKFGAEDGVSITLLSQAVSYSFLSRGYRQPAD